MSALRRTLVVEYNLSKLRNDGGRKNGGTDIR
jgi:hypothetical protein